MTPVNGGLKQGWLVQLNPQTVINKAFGGCFMVVTDSKTWGAQGYVQGLGDRDAPGGLAYYRATWDEMELCGVARWWVETP